MSKEARSTDIEISQFEAGIQMITTNSNQTTEEFNSIEEAIGAKDREALDKKALALSLVGVGFSGITGGSYLIVDSKNDVQQYLVSWGSIVGSFLIINIGLRLYESGKLAREQWQKLKEVFGQVQVSNETSTQTPN